MKQKNFVLMVIAAGCGLVAAVLVSKKEKVQQEAVDGPQVFVVKAREGIPVGHIISDGDVKLGRITTKPYPAEQLPPDVVLVDPSKEDLGFSQLLGKRVQRQMRYDTYFVKSDIGLAPAVLTPPGMVQMPVRVDQVSGGGGFVIPGKRVDVMYLGVRRGKPASAVLIPNALVVAVNLTDRPAEGQSTIPEVSHVSLALTPREAKIMQLAAGRGGSFQLHLRQQSSEIPRPVGEEEKTLREEAKKDPEFKHITDEKVRMEKLAAWKQLQIYDRLKAEEDIIQAERDRELTRQPNRTGKITDELLDAVVRLPWFDDDEEEKTNDTPNPMIIETPMVELVVAKKTLTPGLEITKDNVNELFELRKFAKETAPTNVLTKLDDLKKTTWVKLTIHEGLPVPLSALDDKAPAKDSPQVPMGKAVVAKKNLNAPLQLNAETLAEMFELRDYPLELIPADAVKSLDELKGKWGVMPLSAGFIVPKAYLSDKKPGETEIIRGKDWIEFEQIYVDGKTFEVRKFGGPKGGPYRRLDVNLSRPTEPANPQPRTPEPNGDPKPKQPSDPIFYLQ